MDFLTSGWNAAFCCIGMLVLGAGWIRHILHQARQEREAQARRLKER